MAMPLIIGAGVLNTLGTLASGREAEQVTRGKNLFLPVTSKASSLILGRSNALCQLD